MKQACFLRTGDPAAVVDVREGEIPPLQPHQVLVRMDYAPVNPADLNFIQGNYGTAPDLPSCPGMEGSGTVVDKGVNVSAFTCGDQVLPIHGPGTWATHLISSDTGLVRLREGLDPVQAAMLRVNPMTAWGMLHLPAEPLPRSSWVLQNAGSSAAATCIIQIARSLGWRTMTFVRRAESIAPVQTAGGGETSGNVVLLDTPESQEEARGILASSDAPALLACNAVGGDSATRLIDLLAPRGTLVTYGAMARQPLKVPNRLLIFKELCLRGFWVTRWMDAMPAEVRTELLAKLADLALTGALRQEVAAIYPLSSLREALVHAGRDARGGKVLLDLRDDS